MAMVEPIYRSWWTVVLRGIAAILFGLITFFAPGISLAALILCFAVYALVDGGFGVYSAIRGAEEGRHLGWQLFEGLVSIAAGVVALVWPGLTALALVVIIAARALVNGVLEIVTAIRLRKILTKEWLLGLAGALSILFGVMLFAAPGPGALALLVLIGSYAFLVGVVLVIHGLRLRSYSRRLQQPPAERAPVAV
jgi:uncharacterized membrane protein HdeD (DUF308 family)